MDILMVTPELAPYARASRAGEVVSALTKALCQLDHRVTIAVPRYPGFEAGGLLAARRLTPLRLPSGAEVTVLDGQLPTGATLVLFDAPDLFQAPPRSVDSVGKGDAERSAFLCEAAATLVQQRAEREPFHAVHLHDWPAAPLAALLARLGTPVPTVVTVHDPSRRGVIPARAAERFELPKGEWKEGSGVSLLAAGAAAARVVTMVSTTLASDVADVARFGALSTALASRKSPVVGIPSGLDYAVFNPATDVALKSRYDAEDASNKGISKTEAIRSRGLELELGRPLLVALVEGGAASGSDAFERAVPSLLKNDVTLVVIAAGGAPLERLEAFAKEMPERLAIERSSDEVLVRRGCAAADLVLLPNEYEATGTFARAAQRYGALPIARASGAHIEAIVDADAALETGTGFLFDQGTPRAIEGAVARALAAYASPDWAKLRRRVMRLDLSWDRPARRYAQVYRQAIKGSLD